MNPNTLIEIALTVVIMLLGAIQAYKNAGETIYTKISYLITEAAKMADSGDKKMAYVVNTLYSTVPYLFRKIITKERIQENVQSVYDDMKEFARTATDGR